MKKQEARRARMRTASNRNFANLMSIENIISKEYNHDSYYATCEKVALDLDKEDMADIVLTLSEVADAVEALSKTDVFKSEDRVAWLGLQSVCKIIVHRMERSVRDGHL